MYGLTVVKVIIKVLANGSQKLYNDTIPSRIVILRVHTLTATPANIYCFNKRGFLLFFLEFYLFCFFFIYVWERPLRLYPYLVMKVVLTAIPFLSLTPVQRLPFWLLAFVVTLVEVWMGLWLILSNGFGIDFLHGHFYNHWKKSYRYRAPTHNRRITHELACYAFVIAKLMFLNDYFCYNKDRTKARLQEPHKPTRGDFGYEQSLDWFDLSIYTVILIGVSFWLFIYVYTPLTKMSLTALIQSKITNAMKNIIFSISKNTLRRTLTPLPCLLLSDTAHKALSIDTNLLSDTLRRPHPRPVPEYDSAATGFTFSYDYLVALTEQDTVANLRYGLLFLLALSSLGVYSIILAGWSSNSKYAFIGALRSAAQMISYEVAISLIILPVVVFCGSLNLTMITHVQQVTGWLVWPLLPVALLFLVAMLAETNRTPFDLPEAEAELVAGYNVDYSSLPFAMFFLGEYCNMILISTLYCLLFLSGGLNSLGLSAAFVLALKASVIWVFFVLVRATLPRYRYDQLMDIGWKVFLPVAGAFFLFVFGILVFFDSLPVANELPPSWAVLNGVKRW
jgi:NADH-quinone oxidoreductase subunit H